MPRLRHLLALTALAGLLPTLGKAQTCSVFLSELNYDCALATNDLTAGCEFVELGFGGSFTPGVTPVNGCGIAAVELVSQGSSSCSAYDRIDLPATPIAADGLFVIGRASLPGVDLVPTGAGWSNPDGAIQNGAPDWIRLVGDSTAQDQWYAYEFTAAAHASGDCFVKAGSVGQVAYIGEDYDSNASSPPPVTREESISRCGSDYLGDDEAGNLTGPLATPGEPNACDSRLPWASLDGGVEDAGPAVDAGSSTDAAAAHDAASPRDSGAATDLSVGDHTGGADAGACGALTFIGECQGAVVRWCDDGEVLSYDCAEDDAICGLVDCTAADCYGYDCVASAGEACGPSEVELPCDVTAGLGCLGGVCAPAASCDPDSYVENCAGARILYCGTTRVWDEDCSLGGTEDYICGAVPGGVDCLGLVGAYCDPDYELNCAPGLRCEQNSCQGTLTIDAGLPPTDAGGARDQGGSLDVAAGDDAATADAGSSGDSGASDASASPDRGATVDGSAATDAAMARDATLSLDVYRPHADAGFTEVEPAGACGCTLTESAAGAWALVLAAGVLLLRRRRAAPR